VSLVSNVLICDPIDDIGISILSKKGLKVTNKPTITAEDLLKEVGKYEVIIVRSRTKITKQVIEAARNVKIIARVGVGLDNIDTEESNKRQISVLNSPEAAMNSVSELVIGFMINLSRQILLGDAETKKGNWIKNELNGTELRGKYLGIVGVGSIGRNLGRLARSLRMNLIGYDPVPIDREFVKEVGMIITDLRHLLKALILFHVMCHPYLKQRICLMINFLPK